MEHNYRSSTLNSILVKCPTCKAESMPKMRRRCKSETSDVSPTLKRIPTIDNGTFIVLNSTGNRDYFKEIKTAELLSNSLRKSNFKNSSLPIKPQDNIAKTNKTMQSVNTNGYDYRKHYALKDSHNSVTYQNGITKPIVIDRPQKNSPNLNFNTTKAYSNRPSVEFPLSKFFNVHENNQTQFETKEDDVYKRYCIDVDSLRGTLKELKHSELQQHQFENYIRKSLQDSNKYKEKYMVNEQSKRESASPTNKRAVSDHSYNKDFSVTNISPPNSDMRHSPRPPMHSVYTYEIKAKNKLEYGICDPSERTSPRAGIGHFSNITMPSRNLLDCSGDARRRRTRASSLTEACPKTLQTLDLTPTTETCVHSDIYTLPKRTRELSPNMKEDKPNTYFINKSSIENSLRDNNSIEFFRPTVPDLEEERVIRKVRKSIDEMCNITKGRKADPNGITGKIRKKFKNSNSSADNSPNVLLSDDDGECMGEVSDVDVSDSESACADTESTPSITPSNDNIIKLGSPKEVKGCPFTPSLFPNVPPSISFATHDAQIASMPQPVYKILKWKLTNITPIVVRKTLTNSGFRLLRNSNDWMGTWGKHMKSPCFRTLRSHQKINHFPGTFQIGRKDRLWRNLHKCIIKFGKREFGFIPRTYVLPQDLKILRQSWERYTEKEEKWIIKPPASARGTGIRVVQRWTQIPKRNPTIVQKYIARPLLINGSKFDLRLYVLVTSIHPLRIYLYPDGLARFASVQYSNDPTYLNDRYMHLTNYSINKLSETYKTNEDAKACNGHKWTISSLWKYFSSNGINVNGLWRALADLVVRTMVSGESSIQALSRINTSSRYNCYELFGIDVLLDADLKPWLLEVNISPSLHSASPLDLHVKGPLVQALFNTALYKIPARLSEVDQDEILKLYNLKGPLCYEKKLYTTALSRQEKEKHLEFTCVEKRGVYLNTILENLMPDDVRHLIQAEDELARCAPLERIFPTYTSHKYMEYFETPRYYNRLFDAWEHRYSKRRDDGIALLRKLCEDNVHLQVPVSRSISKVNETKFRAPKTSVSSLFLIMVFTIGVFFILLMGSDTQAFPLDINEPSPGPPNSPANENSTYVVITAKERDAIQ